MFVVCTRIRTDKQYLLVYEARACIIEHIYPEMSSTRLLYIYKFRILLSKSFVALKGSVQGQRALRCAAHEASART